jgi:hypothetical protein
MTIPQKQTNMMNDDSVSECEIGLNKENCGPVFNLYLSHNFHTDFNKILDTTAGLNLNVYMNLSMAVTYSTTLQYCIKMNLSY